MTKFEDSVELTTLDLLKLYTERLRKRGYLHQDVDLAYIAKIIKGFHDSAILEVVKAAIENVLFRNGELVASSNPSAMTSDAASHNKSFIVKMEDFIKAIKYLKDDHDLYWINIEGFE